MAAPPWGSVYTDRDCIICGNSTLDLRAWLRANGIEVPGADGEPEDHIGLMLLLAAWIARQRPALLREYLERHLLTWAPHFLDVVREQTRTPFFEGLALLASCSLAGLQDELSLTVETPRFYRCRRDGVRRSTTTNATNATMPTAAMQQYSHW